MRDLTDITGRLADISITPFEPEEPFIDFAGRFSGLPGTVVLMSGGDLDCARHHILAILPWLSFTSYGSRQVLTAGEHTLSREIDPFEGLQQVVDAYTIRLDDASVPVAAGLFGYLSYDLKDFIEDLPRTSVDDLHLPHARLFAAGIIVVQDKTTGNTHLCVPRREGDNDHDYRKFQSLIKALLPENRSFSGGRNGLVSSFSLTGYLAAVKRIKDYIVSGHIYQVNLSQRFETDFAGQPYAYFKHLYRANPAPFYAYINCGDHHIVSTSPERFLLRRGKYVETRPIKGTRPRGKTKGHDRALGRALQESRKDDAELSMIVDLMRNDLGRVCQGGSVRVAEHKRLESYKNVFHLVSVVKGELRREKDCADLLRATFPGGSITGCPRIRAMEIIDELEPCRRHVYTGAIGYIGFHDTLDLSIAIRTATVYQNRIYFSVGGGVVYDSDPDDEYNETLHKGESLMQALQTDRLKSQYPEFVWQNGALKPRSEAKIPLTDLGFQYGYGLFETIRVEKGRPAYLDAHIRRLNASWEALFKTPTPDLTWVDVIEQLVKQNRLSHTIARVKIIATYGSGTGKPHNPGLVVTAQPYTVRPVIAENGGLDLAVYPHPRQTPLADHKNMNYLYYFLAGKWAQTMGADEALILNPDGSISETNTANILIIKDKTVIRPESPHVLAGIMEQQVLACLTGWGYRITHRKLMPKDLFSADKIIITNSLIGAVPVLHLDKTPVGQPSDLCKKICEAVLQA